MANFFKKYVFPLTLTALACWVVLGGAGAHPARTPRAQRAVDPLPQVDVSPADDAAAAERQSAADEKRFDSIRDRADSALFVPAKPRDTTKRKKGFLDEPITGKNKDSLVYMPGKKMVYIYEQGDIQYQKMNLKADYIRVDMATKNVLAFGRMDYTDSLKPAPTRPEFVESGKSYTMDTIRYNLGSGKAKIRNVATQDGEGWLISDDIKKMPDNSVNVAHGKYTTCDHVEAPHFYLAMTKGRFVPGKDGKPGKIIFGPSYLVFEDVPIYFLALPFGFFPQMSGRNSGFIVPEYGEEYNKGFFLRNGGYYFAFNDYIDATVTGGFYTLGSWEANAATRYLKKYKYSGNFSFRYSKDKIEDQLNQSNFQVQWSHTQDPKFRPNSTFSASVNFSTSGYSKYGSTTLNDYLNSQTSSTIAYSKRWAGKPMSLSMNMAHSQNSRDKSIQLTLPNVNFSVSRIYPFKRREVMGKERWWEKIAMTYTGTMQNTVATYDSLLFTETTLKNMRNGVNHQIPVSASFNLLKYINLSPSFNYTERWYFQSVERNWDPTTKSVMRGDTTYGFNRVWNYSVSMSTSTKVYGTFLFGKNFPVQAIRHVMTPAASISFTPDFSDPKYGYYKAVQTDSTGTIGYYSPYEGSIYGVPGRGKSAALSFSLGNTVEMKVKSKNDTTGVKKIKIIDQLSASSSWNFMADSMNLSPFSLSLRTANLFGNFGISLSAQLDPYEIVPGPNGQGAVRVNRLMWKRGKIGRITSTGWSFGYQFSNSKKAGGAVNDFNSNMQPAAVHTDPNFFEDQGQLSAAQRRAMMTSQYYDFSIPWNLGFNYSLSYSKQGFEAQVTQTMSFNGSVNLTDKWGITFSGGYDFETRKITPGMINLTRDLHCWQMNFSWMPVGFRQSWSFNIGVKSAMLKDLKYDKRSSFYDNLYD